jgi:hypothetical protein
MTGPRYQLAPRSGGTSLFGLAVPQIALVLVGVAVAARLISVGGLTAGSVAAAVGCVALATAAAFVPWNGRPLFESVPVVGRFSFRAVAEKNRWLAPIPLCNIDGHPLGETKLPRCLEGLEIRGVARPDWAGREQTMAPLGLCVDKRTGTVTGVCSIKGAEFQLVNEGDQHDRIFGWGRVLNRFASESAPVARIAWSEWSCPAPLSEHIAWLAEHSNPDAPASADYLDMIGGGRSSSMSEEAAGVRVARHDLRVTITVDPKRLSQGRRSGRASRRDAVTTAVQLLKELGRRCRAEHLKVSPPLGPNEIAESVRVLGHPPAISSRPRTTMGLAERAGVAPAVYGPMAIDATWDAVRIDGTWHRSFWVSAWPTMSVGPTWLEPLLLDTRGTRTITCIMEPVNPRSSRRHLTKESVAVDTGIVNRSSKGFVVPVELHRAKDNLDRRAEELASGFAEYRYLVLIDVAAATLEALDDLSNDYINLAGQCGLELRALDGRHDAAWACTLPIGRAPDRDLIGGLTA